MAEFAHVCEAVWNTKPTRLLFETQRAALAATILRHPGRALFLCMVAAKTDPPDQEQRDASAKMLAKHDGKLAGCACVIEGWGFRAAITRTVLTASYSSSALPPASLSTATCRLPCDWLQKPSAPGSLVGLTAQVEQARL